MNSALGSSDLARAPNDVSAQRAAVDERGLTPGYRWRGIYQVKEQHNDQAYGKIFKAVQVGTLDRVVIRSFKVEDEIRGRAWEKLLEIKEGGMIRPLEAFEADGRRIEVMMAPPATTLKEWAAKQQRPSPEEIEIVLRQLFRSLTELHQRGLVHLNLHPENVYVETNDARLRVCLGGLEDVTLFEVAGRVSLAVDPFYGPPEAVGLTSMPRTRALRAWDWWTLGRVIQELFLGKHVLGHIIDQDVSKLTAELHTKMENVLREQEKGGVRAGGVETMLEIEPVWANLLRGLLSSCRDGRWGAREIARWLEKEPVRERYDLGRATRLFVWKDQPYTVPEAVEFFIQDRNWTDAVYNFFNPDDPSTLGGYFKELPSYQVLRERLRALVKLSENETLRMLPPGVSRDLITAICLLHASGKGASLILRGAKIDTMYLRGWLIKDSQPSGVAAVLGLMDRAVIAQIEPIDAPTARLLSELQKLASPAIELSNRNKWVSNDNAVDLANLIYQCLEPKATLVAGLDEFRTRYSCSKDRFLEKLFQSTEDIGSELAILAYTRLDPARFGYMTHQEWNEEQHVVLRARGRRLTAAITWLRLASALKVGAIVFGSPRLLAVVWGGVILLTAAFAQDAFAWRLAFAVLILAITLRTVISSVQREKLSRTLTMTQGWSLHSAVARCVREANDMLGSEFISSEASLTKNWAEVNDDLNLLALTPKPPPLSPPGKFIETWSGSIAGWCLLVGFLAILISQSIHRAPDAPLVVLGKLFNRTAAEAKAELERLAAAEPKMPEITTPLSDKDKAEAAKNISEDKANTRRAAPTAIKPAWPFKSPMDVQEVRIRETAEATSGQLLAAEASAEQALDRYDSKTVSGLMAVRVSTDSGQGFLLYDTAQRKVTDNRVFTIRYHPLAKTWLQIEDKAAFFLE